MKKNILIIDDDPVIVQYLTSLFEDNGYETRSASSGGEGMKLLDTVKPDLITLDLQMPEEWGPRFYRKLSGKQELKDIPVIVISGLSSSRYAIRKAVAHFTKPFVPDELMRKVKETIGEA